MMNIFRLHRPSSGGDPAFLRVLYFWGWFLPWMCSHYRLVHTLELSFIEGTSPRSRAFPRQQDHLLTTLCVSHQLSISTIASWQTEHLCIANTFKRQSTVAGLSFRKRECPTSLIDCRFTRHLRSRSHSEAQACECR